MLRLTTQLSNIKVSGLHMEGSQEFRDFIEVPSSP